MPLFVSRIEPPRQGEETMDARRHLRARIVAVMLAGCLPSLPATDAAAAVFEVPPGDAPALIAAINAANANGDTDTVNLQGGTYVLTGVDNDGATGPNGLPVITTPITINGNGLTIAASGGFRIFDVASDGRLFLMGLTLENGNTDHGGAGVRNGGHLVVVNTTFHGNRGGEGGAVLNDGTAVVWHSTFTANAAGNEDSGGAIRNNGSMSIVNSTFSGNTAFDDGGAIYSNGPIAISHATLVGNTAGFGGGAIHGSNSGHISTIKNLVVASNTPQNCIAVTVAQGANFDTDGTCGGAVVAIEQLRLGRLAKNGGATRTHALLRRSVAIDAVEDCTTVEGLPMITDQRGMERPQGVTCDAGAYEAKQGAE
jgi:predicted outer membrane repeat protein